MNQSTDTLLPLDTAEKIGTVTLSMHSNQLSNLHAVLCYVLTNSQANTCLQDLEKAMNIK